MLDGPLRLNKVRSLRYNIVWGKCLAAFRVGKGDNKRTRDFLLPLSFHRVTTIS
jgi:hypothetical protein